MLLFLFQAPHKTVCCTVELYVDERLKKECAQLESNRERDLTGPRVSARKPTKLTGPTSPVSINLHDFTDGRVRVPVRRAVLPIMDEPSGNHKSRGTEFVKPCLN